jgi:macrodomain Ter protein organizer (MatP/YcbG family)
VNFLQPVLKLVEKTRDGPRVCRRYDSAQTPYRRLLSLGNLPAATEQYVEARYKAIHPIRLKTALEAAQTKLSAHAARSHPAVMQRTRLGQVSL